MNYMDSSPFRRGPMGMRNRRPAERPTFKGGPFPKDSVLPPFGPGKPFPGDQEITYTPMKAGIDFGNRRPIYDRNGKLIPQRPVLKDTSTVPVPIMDYVGSMTAMAGKKTRKRPPLAMVPGNVVAPNVPEHTGHSNDMFKEDPYRSYNSGYRYNAHGLQPLYFG